MLFRIMGGDNPIYGRDFFFDTAEACNKKISESAYGPLCSIESMDPRRENMEVDVVVMHKRF